MQNSAGMGGAVLVGVGSSAAVFLLGVLILNRKRLTRIALRRKPKVQQDAVVDKPVEDALAFASTVVMPADVTSAEYATSFSNSVISAVRLIHLQAVGVDLEYRGRMGHLGSPPGADSSGSASSGGSGVSLSRRALSPAFLSWWLT